MQAGGLGSDQHYWCEIVTPSDGSRTAVYSKSWVQPGEFAKKYTFGPEVFLILSSKAWYLVNQCQFECFRKCPLRGQNHQISVVYNYMMLPEIENHDSKVRLSGYFHGPKLRAELKSFRVKIFLKFITKCRYWTLKKRFVRDFFEASGRFLQFWLKITKLGKNDSMRYLKWTF